MHPNIVAAAPTRCKSSVLLTFRAPPVTRRSARNSILMVFFGGMWSIEQMVQDTERAYSWPAERVAPALVLALALAGGCTGVDGESGGSEGTTEEPMTTPVRMSSLTDYQPLNAAVITVNEDPMEELDLLSVRHGDEAFTGEYDGKAWMVFEAIPEGSFELHWRRSPDPELPDVDESLVVLATDQRELYTDRVYSGRPDVELATNADTELLLDVESMSSFGDFDRFEVYSYNADVIAGLTPSGEPGDGPLWGDTAITQWAVPWQVSSTRGPNPLVDPGLGDDLWLSHLRSSYLDIDSPADPWYFAEVYTLIEAAPLGLPPMVDGATTGASGIFATTPPKSISADLRTTEFLAELGPSVANPEIMECSLRVLLEPGVELPVYGLLPTLGEVTNVSTTALTDRVIELEYGNPFPVGTETLYVRCVYWYPLVHPIEGDTDNTVVYVDAGWPVEELDGAPLRPLLGSVREVMVGGLPAPVDAIRTGVGATPTLSFEAPPLGVADLYSVRIFTVDNTLGDDASVLQKRRQVLSFATTTTSITVPEGVLEPGSYYYAQITASVGQMPGSGRPYTHTSGRAVATTGLFTP